MNKEQEFYDALKDIFVGAPVEGESGYINLMRVKSRYYLKGVFPKLQKDIDDALEPFPEFRSELFLKLYTFFSRYFSESGSIYFRYTPIHQNIYEKVYTDDRDVMLFWKTHMLYYVKTDRLFKNLETEIDGFKFYFDVSTLEHKRANEKRDIVYELREIKDGVLVFHVYYSEKGKKTNTDDILKALAKAKVKVTEELLERAFRVFEKQSEVDYFINKNAKEFLKQQFDIWLYQYVFSGESQWTETRIKQLQTLKDIAFKVIDFISQFEDELVRIWNKPKFVLDSNYVITLDRIADKSIDLVSGIINHPRFNEQVTEWGELGIVNDDFAPATVLGGSKKSLALNPKYRHLPIDTKYFKDLELSILGLFEDLDNALDGWLIKSENYQALNTILPKFKERVQTIYIDPPFNKEQDADYFYSVKYKDSSWITILENRLWLAKDILEDGGSIFVRCDYNGNMYKAITEQNLWDNQP
jgi:adenine-specific DNA-methyltransferase